MWPFKRKPEPVIEVIDRAAPLRAFRDIGETFNYLGRECIVTAHGSVVFTGFSVVGRPELCADYCDDEGVIRNIAFAPSELPGLIKQNGGK